jgi:hypothetical protein
VWGALGPDPAKSADRDRHLVVDLARRHRHPVPHEHGPAADHRAHGLADADDASDSA